MATAGMASADFLRMDSRETGSPSQSNEGDSKTRVLFINRSYWPDTEATGQLLTELCEDLAGEFSIDVISGLPNTSFVETEKFPPRVRHRHGVGIHQVGHTRFPKRKWWGRLTNWLTYMMSAWWRAIFVRRPDIVVVETDPPMLCLLGWFLKLWHRSKLVIYLQDIYPDVAVVLDGLREGRLTRFLRSAFLRAYRQADRIVVLSRDMRDHLIRRGIAPERISVIPNWVDAKLVSPIKANNAFRKQQGVENKFVVMYSGNIGMAQRLELVLEAAARLKHRSDIVFLMVGDGASRPRLESEARQQNLGSVRFLGYQPKERLAESLSAADLHLITLHPKVLPFLMPSKLYGILASGTASLATAYADTELAEIISEQNVGLVIEPDNAEALATGIAWAADHRQELKQMGESAHRLAQTDFDRPIATGRFASLLHQLGDSPKTTSRVQIDPPVPENAKTDKPESMHRSR